MKKKLFAVLLITAFAVTFGLCACSSQNESAQEEETAPEEQSVIDYMVLVNKDKPSAGRLGRGS